MSEPILVFIISRNRPLYLWASLDSLFKYTDYPHRFIFGDNGSDDPLVKQVVEGFSRRRMFERVLMREQNDSDLLEILLQENVESLARYFVVVESDVMVLPQQPCWLTQFVQLMDQDPELAMLGSFIDQSDFVDREEAHALAPELTPKQLGFLIKINSPERRLHKSNSPVLTPNETGHNPPGRLVIYRTTIVDKLFSFKVRHLNDSLWHRTFTSAGYRTGIATEVRHRHLSLLNLFDYPAYDEELREWFFRHRPEQYRRDRQESR